MGTHTGVGTRLQQEHGQVAVLFILFLVVMIGAVGITIDVGHALLEKRRLQAAVDLGLLAGAQELPNTAAARNQAEEYIRENFGRVSEQDIDVAVSSGCMEPGCPEHDRLIVDAGTDTPTFFVGLFGIDEWSVGADGAACGPCDGRDVNFDIVVVVDRSYSMCSDSRGRYNCYDLDQAKKGVRELLRFFDPERDRVALGALGPGDSNSCVGTPACPTSSNRGRPYSHTTAGPSYNWVTNSSSPYPCDSADPDHANTSGRGRFYRSAGDLMDGSAGNHDSWILVGLDESNDFRLENGTINEDSELVETLECMQHKYWTPIAPAVDEARQELNADIRDETERIIVYLGDGGATAQPMRRTNDGDATSTYSWYTPTPGNNNRPCHDAVAQADRARADGIQVYTIGYAVGSSTCSDNDGDREWGITAASAIEDMADSEDYYFEQPSPGDIREIFAEIGRRITGGTRLVE